jgi:hypothetical protein
LPLYVIDIGWGKVGVFNSAALAEVLESLMGFWPRKGLFQNQLMAKIRPLVKVKFRIEFWPKTGSQA